MFDLMIKILILSMWAGLVLTPLCMIGLKLFYVISTQVDMRTKLLVLLLPLNIVVKRFVKDVPFKKIYRMTMIVLFILLFLGTLFLFYMYKTV